MNNEPNDHRDDALLDAVLGGEAWPDLDASVRHAALAEFHHAQQRRRARRWLAQMAAVAMFAAGLAWWPHHPAPVQTAQVPIKSNPAPTGSVSTSLIATDAPANAPEPSAPPPITPHYISEAELVALFPKGACTVAEVDGRPQLLFSDPAVERDGTVYAPGS